MAEGRAFHDKHGSRILLSRIERAAGWSLFLIAAILLAIILTMQWVD